MRENSTVPGCVVISGFRGRQGANFIGFLMLFLLLPWFMPMQPALADTAQGFPEIAVDNAVITSPQTTFASLLRLTNAYQELVAESGITRENQDRVTNIYQQMEKLFDLSMVPPKYRRHVAAESAVYLREALARYPIPPMEDVPGEDQMVALIDEGRAPLYRLPGTPVVIRKLGEGVYEGRYQFTSATVAEAKNWYGVARAYPYLQGQDYVKGLYEAYFLTPGPLIPVELIRSLPDWMQQQYLDQTVWQWLLLVVTVPVMAALVYLLHLLVRRLAKGMQKLQRNLVLILWPVGVIYITLGARAFLRHQVFLSGEILEDVLFVAKLIILAAVVSLVMRIGSVLTEAVLAAGQFDPRKIEQQLVRLGIRMLTILIAVIIVLEGMQQIGFSLATLVAGAGVTGLAIALAAQDTLKNVFGGLLLAMDRPFEVGQRVRIKGYEGFIQEVGLRSTKIRTLKGHQIIIPNDEAARIEVENIGRRPYIRRDMSVTITYDTPPEKITRAVEILHEILAVPKETAQSGADSVPHPNEAINQPGYPPRVYFNELNADSLNLLVVYWFHPPEQWPSLQFAHRVNMQIMERFNAEGIDFAFPSQTMYLAGDSNRPINLGQLSPGDQASPSILPATGVADTSGTGNTVRPKTPASSRDANIEEGLLHGEDEGEAGDSTS